MKNTFGHDESGDTCSSDGRNHSVTLLGHADLPVPPAVDFGGGEHVPSTAHVSECTLARPVGTTTTDTWDTSDSTTSPPGLGAGLVT